MAIDFAKPATTDNYSSAFVPNIQANQIALAQMLDSSITTITGTPPTNAKRYNRTSSALEEYNGSTWAPITFQGFLVNAAGVGRGGTPIAPFHQFGQNANSLGALFTSAVGVGSVGNGANVALVNAVTQAQVRANWYYNGVDAAAQAGYSPYTVWNFTTGEIDFYRTTSVAAGAGISPTLSMRIDASGNVGIGQTPAVRKLELNAVPAIANQLNGIRLQASGVTTSASEFLQGLDGGGVPFTSIRTGNDGNGYMTFFVGAGPAERMRIDASGNVGIGLTPIGDSAGYLGKTLEVSGPVYARQSTDSTKYLSIGTSGGVSYIEANGAGNQLAFFTVAAERMRIDASGHVTPGANNAQTLGTSGLRWSTVNGVLGNYSGALTALSFDTAASTDLLLRPAGTTRMTVTTDGRIYGTGLHNNAGAVTGVTNQYIASGTYTPSASNFNNVSAAVPSTAYWTRVGNVVHVAGQLTIDPTTASVNTSLNLTLPIATDLSANNQLAGTAARGFTAVIVGSVSGVSSSNDALLAFTCDADAGNQTWWYHFSYLLVT